MKLLNTFLFFFGWSLLQAQTLADFENLNLSPGSFDNDAGSSGFFNSGHVSLPNDYVEDPNFPYWNGWSISSMTDSTTPGFGNQYSCIAGSGAEGSSTYAIGYIFGSLEMNLTGLAQGGVVNGCYVNNSTYAYLSMRDGDGFAKKFGGEDGNDPDFFKLTIRKTLNGVEGSDSIEFYLADYRFDDNAQDFIVQEWTWLDLSSLGPANALSFSLSSSDIGAFGINTPTYFCVDNVQTADTATGVEELLAINLKIWPNPTTDFLQLEWPYNEPTIACISNIYGEIVKSFSLSHGQNSLQIADLPNGVFTLQLTFNGNKTSEKFIKH